MCQDRRREVLVHVGHQCCWIFLPAHSTSAHEFPCACAQVLMATRSEAAPERARALAVAAGLAERLREDYLDLLPESLPFLAELLEDAEARVVAATQRLIGRLEELSGEDLGQYLRP